MRENVNADFVDETCVHGVMDVMDESIEVVVVDDVDYGSIDLNGDVGGD